MNKYGSIQTLTASIAIAGVLTVLTPFILSWSTTLYLVTSTVKGIFEVSNFLLMTIKDTPAKNYFEPFRATKMIVM